MMLLAKDTTPSPGHGRGHPLPQGERAKNWQSAFVVHLGYLAPLAPCALRCADSPATSATVRDSREGRGHKTWQDSVG
jgi:hypothetical protein